MQQSLFNFKPSGKEIIMITSTSVTESAWARGAHHGDLEIYVRQTLTRPGHSLPEGHVGKDNNVGEVGAVWFSITQISMGTSYHDCAHRGNLKIYAQQTLIRSVHSLPECHVEKDNKNVGEVGAVWFSITQISTGTSAAACHDCGEHLKTEVREGVKNIQRGGSLDFRGGTDHIQYF